MCFAKVFYFVVFFGKQNCVMEACDISCCTFLGRFRIRTRPFKEFFRGRTLHSISVYPLKKEPNILEPELFFPLKRGH